jgi:hypothetical protein
MPSNKNGPLGVKTPYKLGSTKKARNGGNKTQVVALHLVSRLLKPPKDCRYHLFLDNLFVSTKMVKYARSLSIAITSTCKDIGGIVQELLDFKKKDKKDVILWGTIYLYLTQSSKVCHIRWKD